MISDQSVRDRVTHDHETLFAVDAGAGTGKTTLLVSRLIALLVDKKASLKKIAAITFTEKAAAELAERLRTRLEEDLKEKPHLKPLIIPALEDMERAPISTIHSFCAGILREYPVEAGVDPQFTLLDEVQSSAFETQAWEHWLKKNLSQPVGALFQFQRLGGTFEQVDVLKQFLKRNRTLLTNPSPLPLPSAAVFKDQWKAFVAFTRKAAQACSNHEDKLYGALEDFWAESQAVEGAPPLDADFELALLDIPKTKTKGNQKAWDKNTLAEIRDGFTRLAEEQEAAFAPFKDAVVLNLVHWIGGFLKEWDAQKVQGGFLDFDDLLLKTRDLLRDHPEAREEMKSRLDYLFVDEFQDTDPLQVEIVFFLAEMPTALSAVGTTKARRSPGGLTAGEDWKKVKLAPGKLFLVGDPKQSIYRFRRADVDIYEKTKEQILANGGKVEVLTENFRTVGGLVDWVNGCFPPQFEGTGIHYNALSANRKAGKTEGTLPILWGLKIPVPPEEKQGKPFFRQLEAEAVADFLKDQVLGGGYTVSEPHFPFKIRPVQAGDIAILFRDLSNDNEEFWEEALRRRDLSYQIVGGKRFYNRPEIVALSTLLTCLSSPADEAVCVAVLRGPIFGFSDEELFLHKAGGGNFRFQEKAVGAVEKAFQCLRDWFQATRTLGVSETLSELYQRTNLLAVTAGQPHGEQRVANLMKILDQARELETSQHFTYRAFTQWLTTQQEEETMEGEAPGPDSSEDRITLMTIHKAKGLEFPIVFVSGWSADPKDSGSLVDRKHSAGAFKAGKAELGLKTLNYESVKKEEELQRQAEDTRLLYVATTRARDCLLLPHFQMPLEGKFQTEDLFAAPLLKALEEKSEEARSAPRPPAEARDLTVPASLQTPVHWAEMKDESKTLEEPRAWVVPLDGKFDSQALGLEKEKWKEHLQGRKEMLGKLSGPKLFQSVTSSLSVDPDKQEKEERVFQEPETASPWGGKSFGVLVHSLMEKGWDWDPETLARAANLYGEKEGVTVEQRAEAVKMAQKALQSDLIQRARKSGKVFRELPMTGKQEDGKFLNAILDLAFLEDGEWVLVDYKTDQDREKRKDHYREQLKIYSEFLSKSTGIPVKEVYLFFVRHKDNPVEKVTF